MPAPRYAVLGNPVAHSRSPAIHQMFAAQEGAQIAYTRTHAENTAAFQAALAAFFVQGGSGANVTLPHKETAYAAAAEASPRAQAAGAANTLLPRADGTLYADNTDGIGLVRDLQRLGIPLSGSRILILGAGGAARGAIQPLLDENPAALTIANRTPEKAAALARRFGIESRPMAGLPPQYDLIINATSGSLNGTTPALPPQIFSGCLLAYDMFYAARPTAFMETAAQNGAARTADGLGMLVGQAAEAYRLWRGFMPDTAPVIAALRTEPAA